MMEPDQASSKNTENRVWTKAGRPALMAFLFQYAYLAFYIGLRAAVFFTVIDLLALLVFFDAQHDIMDLWIWLAKCLIEWPLLGILFANGYLDFLGGKDREFKDRLVDAVLIAALILMVAIFVFDLNRAVIGVA